MAKAKSKSPKRTAPAPAPAAPAPPAPPPAEPAARPTVELWPIDKPIPYANNPRVISDQAVSAVAGSIKAFGFRSPIVVDREGVIITGHTRLRAAQALGLARVPVVVASDLTPAQVKAYRLADNRVAEFSKWDAELLKIELEDCDVPMDFAGFDDLMVDLDAMEKDNGEGYTKKIEAPIYQPTQEKAPELSSLCDASKSRELMQRIADADLPDDVRAFLSMAACRHYRFDYGAIAEYYAHAPAKVQRLMEDSALVIIDFKRAIELGYVKLQEELAGQYETDVPEGAEGDGEGDGDGEDGSDA